MSARPILLAGISLALAGACDASPSAKHAASAGRPPEAKAGPARPPAAAGARWYHARLEVHAHGRPLEFFLQLPAGDNGTAVLVNGAERTELASTREGDEIHLSADWNYVSEVRARRAADDSLAGEWRRYTPLWGHVIRGFSARPVGGPEPDRLHAGPPGAAKVDGYWEIDFERHGRSAARFQQDGDVVTGFVRPGNLGDLRYLAGSLRGKNLTLSYFNGNAANVLAAEISSDGSTLRGQMSMQNVWIETFTARRVTAAPPSKPVTLRPGARTVTLPEIADLKGKPALVIFFATWCASCNDATPFLVAMHRRYRKEIAFLGLAYELNEDEDENYRQIARYRARHSAEFEMKEIPTTPREWAGSMPPELQGWDGLPIFVFVKPDGTVERIVGGWYSGAARDENAQLKRDFESWLKELRKS
jgi:thiol-disulfide isomerase/thioredoxin